MIFLGVIFALSPLVFPMLTHTMPGATRPSGLTFIPNYTPQEQPVPAMKYFVQGHIDMD